MLDVTLSILALIAGGVTIEAFTAARASLRGQDEADFPWRSEVVAWAEDTHTGNPS